MPVHSENPDYWRTPSVSARGVSRRTLCVCARFFLVVSICIVAVSCRNVALPGVLEVSPDIIRESLVRGVTTQEEIFDWLGTPKHRQVVDDHEIWTYEWSEQEQRTAYSGTKIGEERSFMKGVPGYTHTVTRKTIVTLIFSDKGRLNNYQILKQ